MSARERRLYLIRHGHADRRSSQRSTTSRGPTADPPLDGLGREQADTLARRLRLMRPPAALYTSTLQRARQTAEPYAREQGIEAVALEDLGEWHGGEWEFKEFEELLELHPEMPERILLQDPVFHLAPGSETMREFQDRVVETVEELLSRHPDGDLWIVCHGGVINAYVGWVLGIEEQEMFYLPPNTSLNTIKVDGDRRRVWFLADDTHLTEPELFGLEPG